MHINGAKQMLQSLLTMLHQIENQWSSCNPRGCAVIKRLTEQFSTTFTVRQSPLRQRPLIHLHIPMAGCCHVRHCQPKSKHFRVKCLAQEQYAIPPESKSWLKKLHPMQQLTFFHFSFTYSYITVDLFLSWQSLGPPSVVFFSCCSTSASRRLVLCILTCSSSLGQASLLTSNPR